MGSQRLGLNVTSTVYAVWSEKKLLNLRELFIFMASLCVRSSVCALYLCVCVCVCGSACSKRVSVS